MEDPELIALKELKKKLVAKANELVGKLKEQENDQRMVTIKFLPDTTKDINNKEEKLSVQYQRKLCELSRQVSGITFEKIHRKWLHDNVYKYTTSLVTETLNLYVELSVKLEGEKEFEVYDIMCHFVNIDKCYMLEIEPWIQTITRMRNFSLLTTAISQYNQRSMIRNKILNKMKAMKYASCEKCTDKEGGILIYIHSPENAGQVYLIFQWSMIFVERNWNIEHHFVINATEEGNKYELNALFTTAHQTSILLSGEELAKKNQSLLMKFCKLDIKKEELVGLWSTLCSTVDLYKNRDQTNEF